jgi:hypothetical protein
LRIGPDAAATAAYFVCPFVVQFFQTWVHLLGLTFYNLPEASAWARWSAISMQFGKAYAARASRTAVLYSAGGTLNRALLLAVGAGR